MRRYNGKTLKYETLCKYKDFFGDTYSEYKEEIENDEEEWNQYKRAEEIRDRMFNGAS